MEWTDRHCRFFHRLLTRRALIYTEMLTTGAVLHGDRNRLLGFDSAEHPVALQLGGSDPHALAACARIAADFGYDEVNLNVGCPSDRVQEGRFGACLMAEPQLVGDCVAAMKAAVSIPITVKCRIGIDEQDPEEALGTLARIVEAAGVQALIVHARKAWLAGLSPKENREVPPLDYDRVFRLKLAHPKLPIVLNGGVADIEQARPSPRSPRRRDDGTRCVSGALAASCGRSDVVRCASAICYAKAGGRRLDPIHRARTGAGHAPACDHAPPSWPVPRCPGGACLSPASCDCGREAGRRF